MPYILNVDKTINDFQEFNMEKHGIERDTYDANIVPAETAARKEREGDDYKKIPEGNLEGGAAIDNEGLLNNYAVEPEMYYENPGDAETATEPAK
jgi:hypothetical protein